MRKIIITLVIIAAAVTGYAISYPVFNDSDSKQIKGVQTPQPSVEVFVGVVFDNDPKARPQFGLSEADVVFETVAEGGVTRILAFFSASAQGFGGLADKVGPVRSARPYFVDWVQGAGSALAHSGGSREALNKIAYLGQTFHDINEFHAENYFWRDTRRIAPHNLFTSIKLMRDYADSKNWPLVTDGFGWSVDPDPPKADEWELTATDIVVDFSYPQFVAQYQCDEATKNYLRSLGGKADRDGSNNIQIAAKNVVVLYTTSAIIDEKLLTVDLETTGTGRAVVFTGGQVLRGRWQKRSPADQLKLLDADGSSIALAGGPTWIEVLDQNATASWK